MKLLQDLKDLPQIKQRLADAEAKLEGVTELETALEASLKETKETNDKLAAFESAKLALDEEKAKLSADFEAYKADEGKRNAAYAANLIAQTGVKPVVAKAQEVEGKKNHGGLKGLALAIALNREKNK